MSAFACPAGSHRDQGSQRSEDRVGLQTISVVDIDRGESNTALAGSSHLSSPLKPGSALLLDRSASPSSSGKSHTSPKPRATPLPRSLSTLNVSSFASAVESEPSGSRGEIAASRALSALISGR